MSTRPNGEGDVIGLDHRPSNAAGATSEDVAPGGDTADVESSLLRAFALELAETADEARHELLFGRPAQSRFDHCRGVAVLQQFHGRGEPDAFLTALLLCTDRRWKSCTHRLIRAIEETGTLPADELDELAGRFVEAEAIEVRVRVNGSRSRRPRAVTRVIPPPLKRWAAARIVRRGRGPRELLDLAIRLDSKHGAALAAGVLDAIDVLDTATAASVIEVGLAWPRSSVRLVALELLTERAGTAAASARAVNDPDAKVRDWGAKLARRGRQAQVIDGRPDRQRVLFEP